MNQTRWPIISRWLVLVCSAVIVATMLGRPALAQQETDGSRDIIYMDDNGAEDEIYGYARMIVSQNGTWLDAYAYDIMYRGDPNPSDWATCLETHLYYDNNLEDHNVDYYDGTGGWASREYFASVAPGHYLWFDAGYGLMDAQYYDYWFTLGENDLYLAIA